MVNAHSDTSHVPGKVEMADLLSRSVEQQQGKLAELNRYLAKLDAEDRVSWALANLPDNMGVSSSFGIQAAVMLSLLSSQREDIPVILTDTGYLFAETYRFIDELTERLSLNLKVYRADKGPQWQEAVYGKLWEQGLDGLEQYNRMNKVEPMKRALAELSVGTWFAGLRREQASTRNELAVLSIVSGRYKFLPIVDWSNKRVHEYLTEHKLPYHPLWEKGYVSVGDTHSSRPLTLGMSEEETRFNGLKRECGLHDSI